MIIISLLFFRSPLALAPSLNSDDWLVIKALLTESQNAENRHFTTEMLSNKSFYCTSQRLDVYYDKIVLRSRQPTPFDDSELLNAKQQLSAAKHYQFIGSYLICVIVCFAPERFLNDSCHRSVSEPEPPT